MVMENRQVEIMGDSEKQISNGFVKEMIRIKWQDSAMNKTYGA